MTNQSQPLCGVYRWSVLAFLFIETLFQACLGTPSSSVTTQIDANETPPFGIFATRSGNVPFDPAANRIFVRFRDSGGIARGATSVAVRTH